MTDYNYTIYENFHDLQTKKPNEAAILLEEFGQDDYMNEQIYVYDTLNDYAKYETTDGWYAYRINQEDMNFHGAPNLFDYIDYESLGNALTSSWDESMHYYHEETNKVFVTTHRW